MPSKGEKSISFAFRKKSHYNSNMIIEIRISEKALKDLKDIQKKQAGQILDKIDALKPDLSGDVKRLTDFTPEYRLRVGNYRVLFSVEDGVLTVYRVKHRKDAYR